MSHCSRLIVIVLSLFMATVAALATGCRAAPAVAPPGAGVVADWPAYGATPGGTHFSRATQITPENVGQLEVAWHHRSGDYRNGRSASDGEPWDLLPSSMQVTPIVVRDRLYYCTPFNRVFALDAQTGEEIWSFDPGVNMDNHPVLSHCRGVSSWESGKKGFCEHRIIHGTLDARLIALDAETGQRCKDFGRGGEVDTSRGMSKFDPPEYGITSPTAIIGDTVVTGSMVLDNIRTDIPGGIVRAYDVRSGELRWAFNPVPPDGQPKNPDGTWRNGTTNVWSIIAVDAQRNLVFLPTGNTSPDYYGGHRDGLDYYSSSVVALDGTTGEVVWHYQMVHHDIWDYDTPAQPTLVDLTVAGEVIPALVQVTKMGMTFVLNRETGEPIWPIEERPVPQSPKVPQEYLAPTQPFPTHVPYVVEHKVSADDAWGLTFLDRGMCKDVIEQYHSKGIYTPPTEQGTINFPGNAGGNNWGSPAINPDTGVMVVYTNRVPTYTRLLPRSECEGHLQPQRGTPYCVDTSFLMSPLGLPCVSPPWGTLDAIDLVHGKTLWSVPLGTTRNIAPFPFWWIKGLPGMGGPMMTDTGLVFSGVTNEHVIRAFDASTGEELWKGDLPTAGNALPITYQVEPEGRQFVVIAAGGHWSGGSPPGDHIIAFALPGRPNE